MMRSIRQLENQDFLPEYPGPSDVIFLTGKRFIHLTVFCAWSLQAAAKSRFRIEFFDDGTLDSSHQQLLRRTFPRSVIHSLVKTQEKAANTRPRKNFPTLYSARRSSVLMMKILEMHAGRTEPALYLDSDMLFFSKPHQLLRWMESPRGQLYLSDPGWNAYVDTPEAILNITNANPTPGLNSGMLAVKPNSIAWEQLEAWTAKLAVNYIAHPWLEQTLWALIMNRNDATPLLPPNYRILSHPEKSSTPDENLRHYVYRAKVFHRKHEWKRMLRVIHAYQ
jgi:hypothetical protein